MSQEVEVWGFGLAPIKAELKEVFYDTYFPAWPWPTTESIKRVPYTYVERRVPEALVEAVNALIDNMLVMNGIDKEGTHKL